MVAGFWYNQDGIPLQYGTQKAIPELGGDYLMYGENREVEAYISLAGLTVGPASGSVQVPGLPSSFSGTSTPIAAGIQSLTTLIPLQLTAPVTVGASGNGLVITKPQLWVDQIDLEVLVSANAGTGGATGLTSCSLATTQLNPGASASFVAVTPSVGYTIFGAATNANLVAGKHWTWYSDGTVFGSTNPPTAGSFLGNIPLVTNALTPLPTFGWISTLAAGGTFSGTTAAGLMKLRIRYCYYGNIAY